MELKQRPELTEQLSSSSLFKTSFKGLTRRRRPTSRKISRVRQQAVTEKYIKSMNEHAQNDTKRRSERLKLMKFLWKDVKARDTENLDLTLDHDVVDLRDLDPDGTLLKYAVIHNYLDVLAVLLRHSSPMEASGEDGLSPLHLAIKLGYIPMLAMILANNPPINVPSMYEKRTPLHVAVRVNNTEALDLLLQHGADPNKPDIYGSTSLHLAARLGRDHLIKHLIEHEADVQARDNEGWTAMHVASEAGHASTVRILLQNNSIVDAQSKYGKTPLHWACEKGHLQVVQALLDSNANPVIRALNNKTARDYAVTPLLRNLLESYTKKPTESICVPRKEYFDCRLRNKSLIDLLDLSQFQDPYANELNQDTIGKGAMQDELSKPIVHSAKSMPYMLDSCHETDSVDKSTSGEIRFNPNRASIKSSLSFASFTTVADSEIDFAMDPRCESIPVLSLDPIEEEAKYGESLTNVNFNIGDSGLSDCGSDGKVKSGNNSPIITTETNSPDYDVIESITAQENNIDRNHNIKATAHTDSENTTIQNIEESFQCTVPTRKLIETLEDMHEQVDTSVDENVDILNDVFRDVTLLRHKADDFDVTTRENTFDNIEKNIKDIVVRLKELKVRFDGHIFDF